MKTPPIKAVKDRFGDKEKLVAAVKSLATEELWLDRVSAVKGLEKISNAKLLRLHEILTRVKKEFGSRGKLVEAILALLKRGKDAGLRSKLEASPTPQLVDLHDAATRRAKATARKAKVAKKAPAAKKKKARSKKAKAKAAAKK